MKTEIHSKTEVPMNPSSLWATASHEKYGSWYITVCCHFRGKTKIKEKSLRTSHLLLSALAGFVLIYSGRVAVAENLIVNAFDTDISGIAWENWRSYVTGHAEVWDPSQDADGNTNSGSMYVTVNWPTISDPTWNNGWNDVQIAFGTQSFDSSAFIDFEAYIKIDVTNSFSAQDGSYGVMGLYVNSPWSQVQGYAGLRATNGWQRIHGSFSGIPSGTYNEAIIGLISNGGSSLTNTVNYWIDNIRFTAPPSVNTNRPALSIVKAPPSGLTCIASQPGDAWQRQMIRTVNSGYSWYSTTSFSDTTTYSITLADFPGVAYSGFEALMYLIPVTGMSNPDGGSVDWDSAHVAYFTITRNADGTGNGNFRYKINSPSGETFQNWTDFASASGPLGTWALTFNNDTNVIITAPDSTSTSFTIPDSDAANFQGPLIAYFGVRPTDDSRVGQSATFSRIKITGGLDPIDDNFVSAGAPYVLDPNTWVKKASNPQGIIVTAPDAKYWVCWPTPDTGYETLYATDDLTKQLGTFNEWLSLPTAATGWINVGGVKRLTIIDQSTLDTAFTYTPVNCFFGLFHQ
jgi:hypothetical protein